LDLTEDSEAPQIFELSGDCKSSQLVTRTVTEQVAPHADHTCCVAGNGAGEEHNLQRILSLVVDTPPTSLAMTSNKNTPDQEEHNDYVAEDEQEYSEQQLDELTKVKESSPLPANKTLMSNKITFSAGDEYSMQQILELTTVEESPSLHDSISTMSTEHISDRDECIDPVLENEHSIQQTLESIVNHVPLLINVDPVSEEEDIKARYRQHLAQKFSTERPVHLPEEARTRAVQEPSQYQAHMKQYVKLVGTDNGKRSSLPPHMVSTPATAGSVSHRKKSQQGGDDEGSDEGSGESSYEGSDEGSDEGSVATGKSSDELLTKQADKLVADLRHYISHI